MIGQTVWVFNENHRVYAPKEPGKLYASGGPIYREHWQPETITSETPRLWVTNRGTKFPKKDPNNEYRGICRSKEELEDKIFLHDHNFHIGKAVGECHDIAKLKEIAKLIGYDEEKKK